MLRTVRLSYRFLFFLLVVLSFSSSSFGVTRGFLEKSIRDQKESITAVLPGGALIPEEVYAADGVPYHSEAGEIKDLLQEALPEVHIQKGGLLNTLKVIDYYKKNKRRDFHKVHSLYVHADKIHFQFSFQIYEDGSSYIHLGSYDPKKTKGGFKSFSRSLNLEDKQFYASLRFPLSHEGKFNDLKEELTIMKKMKRVDHNLTIENFAIYQTGYDGTEKVYEGIFQTKLFDGTLSVFSKERTPLKRLLKLMIMASESVRNFHRKGFAHRDIKKDNFFVNYLGDKKLDLTLADYGLANPFSFASTYNGLSGTKGYKDPYFCQLKQKFPARNITFGDKKKSDIFALGMTFYSIIFSSLEAKGLNYTLNLDAKEKSRTYSAAQGTLEERVQVMSKLDEKIAKSYEAYASYIKKIKTKMQEKEKVSLQDTDGMPVSLKSLVLDMISPRPNDRPSIRTVLTKLKRTLKAYAS